MNDFNYAEGKKATLDEKFPYFEWVYFFLNQFFWGILKIMAKSETSKVYSDREKDLLSVELGTFSKALCV